MQAGAYVFLPNADRYEPLYAITDRNQKVRFFSLHGYSFRNKVAIPVEQAMRFGRFIRMRAFVDLLDFMPAKRSRVQSALQHINGMKIKDKNGSVIFPAPDVPAQLHKRQTNLMNE